MPAIDVRDLRKVYREGRLRRRRFEALRGITFSVPQGQVFGLLGPNGAGKTTFIKILLGIIRKSGGSASMLGLPAGSQQGRAEVGYLPESLRIPRHLTPYSALEYYGSLNKLPLSEIRSRRDDVLQRVGLASWARVRVTKFSKGMQQRLGLAQAILHRPSLLVLDEPTDGLDPRARADVRAIIRQMRDSGVTVFLNSHLLQEVELICDQVAILDRGQLRYSGTVAEIGKFVAAQLGDRTTGLDVLLSLAGDSQSIQQALDGIGEISSIEPQGETVEVRLQVNDQNELDRAVDRLRLRQISLLTLQRHRVTLEDAFLRLLATGESAKDGAPRMEQVDAFRANNASTTNATRSNPSQATAPQLEPPQGDGS